MSPWLPEAEFKSIFSKVPRLNVEVVAISDDKSVLLTKRDIQPCKGCWHIPGGTVYFGEAIEDAVRRLANKELGMDVTVGEFLGYIEYPSHYENGLDTPVGLTFTVKLPEGSVLRDDAAWFDVIPPNMHPDQDVFLVEKGLMKRGPESSVFSHGS